MPPIRARLASPRRSTLLGSSTHIEAGTTVPAAYSAAAGDQRATRWWIAALTTIALVVFVIVAWPRGALWLDEAQSVAIARQNARGMLDGLRADGAPPLYYVFLHAWMALFGDGDRAVRLLSAVFGLAALGVLGLAAQRIGGRRSAVFAVVVAGLNPFFVRYASETRMYTLVMLEVSVAIVLMHRAFHRADLRLQPGLVAITSALLYTHYWGIYLIAATGLSLLVLAAQQHQRGQDRRAHWALASMALGGLCWLPWLPVFRFQSQHTGTPWTQPSAVWQALGVVLHRATGESLLAIGLSVALTVLLCAGMLGSARSMADRQRCARTRQAALAGCAAVLLATFAIAFVASRLSNSAFVARYTMVMFPLEIVIVAGALTNIRPAHVASVVVAVLGIASAVVSIQQVDDVRTRAPLFADALQRDARPGDVVVYCPDQLGPSIDRLLRRDEVLHVAAWTFPQKTSPQRVDWIDYRSRHERASAPAFGRSAVQAAGSTGTVWLVLSTTYPATQTACAALHDALGALRPAQQVISDDPGWQDHDSLWRYDS